MPAAAYGMTESRHITIVFLLRFKYSRSPQLCLDCTKKLTRLSEEPQWCATALSKCNTGGLIVKR